MNNKISLTWKNIIILIVIFYVIGDILLGIRMKMNQVIDKYEKRQAEIRMNQYQKEVDSNWKEYEKNKNDRYKILDSIINN